MRRALGLTKRQINWYALSAIAFGGIGLGVGLAGLLNSDPFLGLFGISIVCSGAIAALLGLHD